MCEKLDDNVNQRIEAEKRKYQIHLGDLCMVHREARSEQKEFLVEKALIPYSSES